MAIVSILSIFDPFFTNISAKEKVNLSDYSEYITLEKNEKLRYSTGYIEDGVLTYEVNKTTTGITGYYYKYGSWSNWSGYSLTKATAASYNQNTYKGDKVTEREVRSYNEYRYATRSLVYTYSITLSKKVNGKMQYKTRTGSLTYPIVADLQILGWKITNKSRSSSYTSWSTQNWQKTTRTTSATCQLAETRTYYSYRTRTATWTAKYGDVTTTSTKNATVYRIVKSGKPVSSTYVLSYSDSNTFITSYYFKAGDCRKFLNDSFDSVLNADEIAWYYELKNIVNSFFEVAALYGDEWFNKDYIDLENKTDKNITEIPLAVIDLIFCALPKNRINYIMGAVNSAVTLLDKYQSHRLYGIMDNFKKTLASAKDNNTICLSFKT